MSCAILFFPDGVNSTQNIKCFLNILFFRVGPNLPCSPVSPVVMEPGQKILTLVGSGQIFVAWVRPAIFGLGLGLENFP